MAQDTCSVPLCRDSRDRLCVADIMLREANHRIANSLQAVMAAAAADASPNGILPADARGQMMTRVAAIALVHRMLSVSTISDTIAIGDYLTNLCESIGVLWSKPGGARIAVHHGDVEVATDVAVRLGMVVNELVTNSFKYAYGKGTGEIRVAFSVMEGSFVLIVADDGRGIDALSVTRQGTGMRLVEGIAK